MENYRLIKTGVKYVNTSTGRSEINFDKELTQQQLKSLYDNGYTEYIEYIEGKICECGNTIEDKRRKECEECRTKDWDNEA